MQAQPSVTVSGFGLRIAPLAGQPFRLCRTGEVLVVESQHPDGWRSVTVSATSDLATTASELASVARVEQGPSSSQWWIETSAYRIPLPAAWTLHTSSDRAASSPFELLGPADVSISVRTSRRMPSIEAFQGPGHVFRDVGQLDRAGWIEFEHTEASRTWLHRHEQLHRGTTPFIVTLKAELDQAGKHMDTLASIVEQLELIPSKV